MTPSPEAVDWQRRADQWAQQAEPEQGQAVEPANRWSEVASTGRPAFPADGVGWRSETSEWLATGAHWRRTTEWRSTSGSHGWRSTTEAWQTGGEDDATPPAETPNAQPAISSTAWSAAADSTASWQQPATDSRPSWQQLTETSAETPSWQRPAPESAPSWQGGAIDGASTWNDPVSPPSTHASPFNGFDAAPSWPRPEAAPEVPSWQRSDAPSWQTPRDDGRHLVREDDRAAWRRDADLGEKSRQIGRRRAPEDGSRPSGGTGWAAREEADNWAGHADTGSLHLFGDLTAPESPTWGARSEAPSRYGDRTGSTGPGSSGLGSSGPGTSGPGSSGPGSPGRRRLPESAYDSTYGSTYDEAPPRRAEPTDAYGAAPYGSAPYADPTPSTRPIDYGTGAYRAGAPRRAAPDGYDGDSAAATRHGEATRPISLPGRAGDDGRPGFAPSRYADEPGSGDAGRGYGDARATGYPSAPVTGRGGAAATGYSGPTATGYSGPAAPGGRTAGDDRHPGEVRDDAGPSRHAGGTRYPDRPVSRAEAQTTRIAIEGPDGRPARRGVPDEEREQAPRRGRGPSRYHDEVQQDWREQTGSWAAEPDTSSWTRDPDTGQWSRSADDPRVLAWREEVARREATGESPAGPMDDQATRRIAPITTARPADDRSAPDRAVPDRAAPDRAAPDRAVPDRPVRRRALPAAPSDSWRRDEDGPDQDGTARAGAAPTSGVSRTSDQDDDWRSISRAGSPDQDEDRRGSSGGARGRSGAVPTSGGTAARSNAPRSDAPRSSAPRSDAPSSSPRSGMPASSPRSGVPQYGAPYGPPRDPYAAPSDAYSAAPAERYGAGPRATPYGAPQDPYDAPQDPYGDDRPARGRRRAEEPPSAGRRRAAPEPDVDYGRDEDRGDGRDQSRRREQDRWPEPQPMRELERRPDRVLGRPASAVESGHGAAGISAEAWRRDPEPRPNGRLAPTTGADDEVDRRWPPGGATPERELRSAEPAEAAAWQRTQREDAARGSATYREGGADDWRRDLADQGGRAEGEPRRNGTSDYTPFRSSGSAAVAGSSNLSMTSTSLISPLRNPSPYGDPSPYDEPVRRSSNGFNAPSGAYERRPVTGPLAVSRKVDLLTPDSEEEEEQTSGGPLAAVGYTVIWYGVPVVLFVIYMLVANNGPQSHALATLAKAAPQFGISLVLSVLVAIGIRWASTSWKAISVGLASAVVGGGLATVLSSAITGNSLS